MLGGARPRATVQLVGFNLEEVQDYVGNMAHGHGVPVMVDGAHAFAQLEFAIPDLRCEYYGSSLHKWLGCPLGAGLL